MSRYELATGAAADLLEIVRYSRATWGAERTQRYREELELALQQLALAPGMGRKRDAIALGIRSFPAAEHIAFYVARKGRITILRILHPRMDVDEAFEKGR